MASRLARWRSRRYAADPSDAVASARALLEHGEGAWIAGNCHRMIRVGDLLLFKFGGARLMQKPGVYAAARVTRAPRQNAAGKWVLRYEPDAVLTKRLLRAPIIGDEFARIVPRSFGASIQVVESRGQHEDFAYRWVTVLCAAPYEKAS